ncbi:hypothetical protein IU459_17400 [Nocardia amamiensis]|uniref:Uncharacterized protein n=1 Tax=Nocardia amamiensis TaxID=404578 RepID=A0ABS0CSM3_9NOCA|nr:hypothetical protein [Nocardia amamiensis]MBF6299306.1 hypothetical protein [Nocardia amamiensis]
MTSAIPAPIAIPLIAFVALVAVGRLVLLRHTAVDRLHNRAMLWGVATLILLERGIAPQIGSLLHQLSMGTLLMAVVNLYGAAKLWAGADSATALVRQRAYDSAGLAASRAGTPLAEGEDGVPTQISGHPAGELNTRRVGRKRCRQASLIRP